MALSQPKHRGPILLPRDAVIWCTPSLRGQGGTTGLPPLYYYPVAARSGVRQRYAALNNTPRHSDLGIPNIAWPLLIPHGAANWFKPTAHSVVFQAPYYYPVAPGSSHDRQHGPLLIPLGGPICACTTLPHCPHPVIICRFGRGFRFEHHGRGCAPAYVGGVDGVGGAVPFGRPYLRLCHLFTVNRYLLVIKPVNEALRAISRSEAVGGAYAASARAYRNAPDADTVRMKGTPTSWLSSETSPSPTA